MNTFRVITTFLLVYIFASNSYLAFELFYPAIKEFMWYVMLFGTAVIVIVADSKQSLTNFSPKAFVWILVFTLVTIMGYLNSSMSQNIADLVTLHVKGIVIIVSFSVIIATPESVKAALYSLLLVVLVGVGINIMDYFEPISLWEHIPGRSAGYFFDANLSATMLIMCLIFVSLIIPPIFIWPLIIITTLGVLTTFSRGGWAELFVAAAGISLITASARTNSFNLLDFKATTFVTMIIGALIAVGFVYFMFSGEGYQLVKDTWLESYLSTDTMSRISGEFDDGSSTERQHILKRSIQVGLENPLIGAGLGFLWFNFYPAQVFMGDTGSLALGGVFGIIAILVKKELLLPLLGGIFFIETVSVILQRGYFKYTKRKYGEGKRIFKMSPIHHHYELLGWAEPKIVMRFYIITIILVIVSLASFKVR